MLALVQTISSTFARNFPGLGACIAQLRRASAERRADRERVEEELFRGRYHLSSKNDDDLPLVR